MPTPPATTARRSASRPCSFRESFEPGHPLANARGIVSFSNVDPLIEIADAREANRSFQANLTIFDQARRMYGGVLDLLRR
jgi:flagellar basal-body rod protein FlgC